MERRRKKLRPGSKAGQLRSGVSSGSFAQGTVSAALDLLGTTRYFKHRASEPVATKLEIQLTVTPRLVYLNHFQRFPGTKT